MTQIVHLRTNTKDPPVAYFAPKLLRRARLVVCGKARDLDDARLLLEALGLIQRAP